MKVTQVLLSVHECIKYDGQTNRIELFAVKLSDGRYVNAETLQAGSRDGDDFVWMDEEVADTELQEFLNETQRQVQGKGWVYTSNPEVYGYPEEYFELCGRMVSSEEVNGFCKYDSGDDPGPFVLDLVEEPNLTYATLEPNFHNKDGSTVVLYFDGVPTEEHVRKICETELTPLNLGVDTNDKYFSFEEHPTPVSKRAGLRRYEVYPTC